MIDIKLFDKEIEEELWNAVVLFNQDFKKDPKFTLEKNYYELWKEHNEIELLTWRNFYKDDRVREFYKQEFDLNLESKKHKLIAEMGANHSTATNQAVIALLKREEEETMKTENNTIIVYSFIPLNDQERNLENVRILENIPEGIKAGLTIYEGDTEGK